MSEAGYTLTETLAAMAVLGLGVGGFAFGMQVMGAQQLNVGGASARLHDLRAAEVGIERLLQAAGPFRAQDAAKLTGGATGFQFACGAPAPCRAELVGGRLELFRGQGQPARFRLPAATPARFVYRGAEVTAAWPPPSGAQALKSVLLIQDVGAGAAAVLDARVWTEQPHDCAFDPIQQDCQ